MKNEQQNKKSWRKREEGLVDELAQASLADSTIQPIKELREHYKSNPKSLKQLVDRYPEKIGDFNSNDLNNILRNGDDTLYRYFLEQAQYDNETLYRLMGRAVRDDRPREARLLVEYNVVLKSGALIKDSVRWDVSPDTIRHLLNADGKRFDISNPPGYGQHEDGTDRDIKNFYQRVLGTNRDYHAPTPDQIRAYIEGGLIPPKRDIDRIVEFFQQSQEQYPDLEKKLLGQKTADQI